MGKRKMNRKDKPVQEESDKTSKAPHSFVMKRGPVDRSINDLVKDIRLILEPFTASNLRVRKNNVVRDFVSVAGSLNVSHMVMLTMASKGAYLRLCRFPRGPTLTYKIEEFTLGVEVRNSLRRPIYHESMYRHQPLLVMNSFSGDDLETKLQSSMWKHLFPSFDTNHVNLDHIKRCVLMNYDASTKTVQLRHYAVRLRPVGLTRAVRKMVSSRKVPNLGRFKDIEEMMFKDGAFTESEGEGDEDEFRQVTVSQPVKSRGNLMDEKSAIRLTEIGPRITMSLFKIEEDLMSGDVLFHSIVKKSGEEAAQLRNQRRKRLAIKSARKFVQESNVKRKKQMASVNPSRGFEKKKLIQAQLKEMRLEQKKNPSMATGVTSSPMDQVAPSSSTVPSTSPSPKKLSGILKRGSADSRVKRKKTMKPVGPTNRNSLGSRNRNNNRQ